MKKAIFVSLVLGMVAGSAADPLRKPRSATYKSDDDYAAGSSASAAGPYPASQTEVRYPIAAEEGQTNNQESHSYAQSQPIENPAYDPNMYQNFVPQDSVQQYVSQYAGHPYPQIAGPNGGDPYAGGLVGPTGYSMGPVGPGPVGPGPFGGIPYGPGFPPGGPGAFTVQSGYEGFLVPSVVPPPPPPPFFTTLTSILPYPRSMLSLVMRSGDYILRSLSYLFFGGVFTTAVCSLTPLCTITFPFMSFLRLPAVKNMVQNTLATEVTTDRVARAAEFVGTALIKYQKLQAELAKETEKEVAEAKSSEVATEETRETVNADDN